MSAKTVLRFKTISPSFLRKAVLPYFNFSGIAGRMFATARPKVDPSFVDQTHPSNTSRAHLTARSPCLSIQPSSCATKQEEHPVPQHEPDPFALMVPLKAVNPTKWQFQCNLLNSWRQPLEFAQDRELRDQNSISSGAPDQKSITERLRELLNQQSEV